MNELINRLLMDSSNRVRALMVSWVGSNNFKQFLPMLNFVHSLEKNEALKKEIAREISLLSDGYLVEREVNGIYVTLSLHESRVAGYVEPLLMNLGDEEIVELFRKKSGLQ